ncbi:hypothetical protein L6164_017425 [Bauhinia variegata]|uniref:Uncharacterized protein n=1 Tax=Bauhinia variegata TaxID=167791 RepID=A0ACB9N9S5_BAUVA|nr:hypothetical protein L6164_017425 [Bauhinia variegata]
MENLKKKLHRRGLSRGSNQTRTRTRTRGKAMENEEPDPTRQRSGAEQLLHHPSQQNGVLLQHLRHYRHEYHLCVSPEIGSNKLESESKAVMGVEI